MIKATIFDFGGVLAEEGFREGLMKIAEKNGIDPLKFFRAARDSSIFRDVCSAIGIRPDEAVFVDDNIENIKRASAEGLNVIHFKNIDELKKDLYKFIRLTFLT